MDSDREIFYGYRNREWLKKEYVEEGRTMQSIAAECGVTKRAICNWIHRFGIKPRSRGQVKKEDRLEALMESVKKKQLLVKEYQKIRDFLDDREPDISETDKRIKRDQKRLKLKLSRIKVNEKKQRQAVHSMSAPFSVETELAEWQEIHDTPLKR